MNKYDYGYELTDASTNNWAYNHISSNTTVLELGPSNGNLIFHLSTQKNCIADIVELDEESGSQAACFARNSCLGIEEGNLEKSFWNQKLQGNLYDYIVILDVLEHIRNPKEVLSQCTSLLKEDGKILLSIPNIAHNSVIINLLQNKLEYTSVGLLDDTHVHFYTYQSVLKMLQDVGLNVVKSEVKQVAVNNNEIDAAYGVLPREIDAYMKTRDLGTAYQFLLTISKSTTLSDATPELMYQRDTLYTVVAFDKAGTVMAEKKVNPLEEIRLEIPVSAGIDRLRIDPLDSNCIISAVAIIGRKKDNEDIALSIAEMTGSQFEDNYVFYDDDPQIYIDIPVNLDAVIFTCHVDVFDNTALASLAPSRDIFRQSVTDYMQVKCLYEKANNERLKLQNKNQQLQEEKKLTNKTLAMANDTIIDLQNEINYQKNTIVELQEQIEIANSTISELQEKLQTISNTIWGKIYHKLNK